ncbi:putative MalT-like TPR region domain-containing protein [Seiridium cardinale]|uniref:MalT-like TPR region domain-containing protein n=1 Tax=Seiridium cardinale TaxID=138064 RepID=A0ABR2XH02_9PEZI
MAKLLLEAVWDRNQKALKYRNEYKDPPVDALDFRYHPAQAIRWQGEVRDSEELLEEVAKHLSGIYQGQDTWDLVIHHSLDMFRLHEAQLGENHPDTLRSLPWLLTVQVFLGDQHAMRQGLETALKRIRSEAVREQRLVESLNPECKKALVVEEFDKPRALRILEEIQSAIEHHTVSCASSMTQSLATLGSNVDEKRRAFGADLSNPEV